MSTDPRLVVCELLEAAEFNRRNGNLTEAAQLTRKARKILAEAEAAR